MNLKEQQKQAKAFVERWKDKFMTGSETVSKLFGLYEKLMGE